MKHRRSDTFKRLFSNLPPEVQEQAREKFPLFRDNRDHPSLAIEAIQGKRGVFSGRITRGYRWTFHFEKDDDGETVCVHRVIGPHDDVYRDP